MEFKWKEFATLMTATIAVSVGLSVIGLYLPQAVWRFDASIISLFLLGDYAVRGILKLRKRETYRTLVHLLPLNRRPLPAWTKLGFASVWFLIVILLAGEVGEVTGLFAGVIYAGKLPPFTIVELSLFLSFWLSVDFINNYRKELTGDAYWENNIP